MKNFLIVVTVFVPVLVAIGVDLDAFGRAKATAEENGKPEPKFNWPLAAGRWVAGLCLGLTNAGLVNASVP